MVSATIWFWNPRYRKKVLVGFVEARLKELLAEIAMRYGFDRLAVEVMPDPVHLFVSAPPKFSPGEFVRLFKGITSRRLKKEFESIRPNIGGQVRLCGQKVIPLVRLDTLARKPSNELSRKVKSNSFKSRNNRTFVLSSEA